jgi:hypothetical protein
MTEDFGQGREAISRTDVRTSVARPGWDGVAFQPVTPRADLLRQFATTR